MILLLSLRNILRNWKNSLTVIILIALVGAVHVTGSSLITQSAEGLRKSWAENLTGDLVIQRNSEITMNLFGANTPIIEEFFSIPVLPAFDAVRSELSEIDGIAALSSQVSGQALMDLAGVREPVPLCGINPGTYFDLFTGIQLEEGRFLVPREYGVMITSARAKRIETRTGAELEIGTPVLLTSAGTTGFKIREVPLVGIYSYKNPGQFMEEVVLADPQTVRALSSVLRTASEDVEVEDDALSLLEGETDSLFGAGSDDLFGEAPGETADKTDDDTDGDAHSDAHGEADSEEAPGEFTIDSLRASLSVDDDAAPPGDTSTSRSAGSSNAPSTGSAAPSTGSAAPSTGSAGPSTGSAGAPSPLPSGGDWNFILLRLEEGAIAPLVQSRINSRLAGYDVKAVSWRTAAGNAALLVLLVQSLFTSGLVLVGIAGIIAMVNILLISVFRRTKEIGTLRAIGASDGYIRTLVYLENIILALTAGVIGILIGYYLAGWVNSLQIPLTNQVVASMAGGPVLVIKLSAAAARQTLLLSLFLGLIASVIPVETAVRIDPIVAVRRG